MSAKNSQTISYKIDSTPQIDKKQLRSPLEIFLSFLGCHQKFMLCNLRGRWSFGMKSELEMIDDLINDFMILDKRDNRHPAPTLRTDKKIYPIYLAYHLSPTSGRNK